MHQTGMNKRTVFTLLFVAIAFLLQAQSGDVRLYGFKKRAAGGMQKRGDIEEGGKLIKTKPAEVFQYTIWLVTESRMRIYPVQLWIRGEAFSVKADWIPAAQLLQNENDAYRYYEKLKTVVTKAGGAWKLTPLPLVTDKSGERAKALAVENDVVALYKLAGKVRYGVLKKFTELDEAVLQ